ncbi:MAG: RnfABCDGE type electron transport complex subunit G [Bacteroidales bacterium]|nr:RnfABCDGE type electron transport complex subunit G [Bacteroidales bacterium]
MKSTLRTMTLSLGIIAIAVAALLAAVNLLTRRPIADAARQAATAAVADVLPPFDNDPLASPVDVGGCTLYRATLDGNPAGTAVRVVTPDGFSGPIAIMVGFDTAGRLTGYTILEHTETPGLGAKAPQWFCDTTGNRSVIGTDRPLALTKDGGTVDGITAATITSRAFIGAINRARQAINQSTDR